MFLVIGRSETTQAKCDTVSHVGLNAVVRQLSIEPVKNSRGTDHLAFQMNGGVRVETINTTG